MNDSPNFITVMDDEEILYLYVRSEQDRDYFLWGEITESQRDSLNMHGVFDISFEAISG